MPIMNGIFAVYYAAVAEQISQSDAVERTFNYAQARIELEKTSTLSARSLLRLENVFFPMALAATSSADFPICDSPRVIALRRVGPDDFLLTFECGPGGIVRGQVFTVDVLLQPPGGFPPPQSSLGTALLAGDPRVHINPRFPGKTKDDPPNKTALIIAPYVYHGSPGNPEDVDWLTPWSDYYGGNSNPAPDPGKFSIIPALESAGYRPVPLLNDDASVFGILRAMEASPNPGIVIFDSHGNALGQLWTSDHWKHSDLAASFSRIVNDLRSAGYDDLVDYNRKQDGLPVTLDFCATTTYSQDPDEPMQSLCLTPEFWKWARDNRHFKLDLSRSLVYMNACLTDMNDELRNAIHARAYFAWKGLEDSKLTDAVAKYLVASLNRSTHSAEESFYNLMRIAASHQKIFVEDKFLDDYVGKDGFNLGDLNAYGSDSGVSLVSYRDAGWLGAATKTGGSGFSDRQVWWLLFAERWSPDSNDGKIKIQECWKRFWSANDLGGLRSPQCNSYNNGSLPKDEEVAYAVYLLTGDIDLKKPAVTPPEPSKLEFSGAPVPRWTLNDGRSQ
jgi:hypothetical protein